MLLNVAATRYVNVDGCKVIWQNIIGGMGGQKGLEIFANPEDAQAFAQYASNGFPSLHVDDLKAAAVPTPIERNW